MSWYRLPSEHRSGVCSRIYSFWRWIVRERLEVYVTGWKPFWDKYSLWCSKTSAVCSMKLTESLEDTTRIDTIFASFTPGLRNQGFLRKVHLRLQQENQKQYTQVVKWICCTGKHQWKRVAPYIFLLFERTGLIFLSYLPFSVLCIYSQTSTAETMSPNYRSKLPYPSLCCRMDTIISTAKAPAIMARPGLLTVHCWSRVRSLVDWKRKTNK